tara:strand:+ start:718 stop:2268 length:1551 start_codon:yes stop_codon:yes gene_type:complete
MKKKNYEKLFPLLLFFALLVAFKVDYRIVNEMKCCGDDFDYYSHAYTIAVDFDFDYSNQLTYGHSEVFYVNEKIAPLGFVGSGLLATPFMFLGNIFDNLNENETVSNKLLFYSLSPIFYFFLAIKLLNKSLTILNKRTNMLFLILLFMGSGVTYYGFERFSMTHIYEIFTVSLIFYITTKINESDKKRTLYVALLPLSICIGLLVRFTNYYLFLLPYLFTKLFFKNKKIFFSNNEKISFLISSVFSMIIFYLLTVRVYGFFTLNPSTLYMDDSKFSNYIEKMENFINFISYNLSSLSNILFTQEFGLFWFSPILFFGTVSILIFLLKKEFQVSFLIFVCFVQNFAVVIMWQSTASSYGFRYLFSLIPLSIILFYSLEKENYINIFKTYILLFSILGALGVLFFESTESTQLSLSPLVNSFGNEVLYSNPKYLSGLLDSIFKFEAITAVIGSSFLIASLFKIFMIFNIESDIIDLLPINLPQEFYSLLNKLEGIQNINFLFLLILFYYFSIGLIKNK